MSFDYSGIPVGYYDQILHGPGGMRRFWHFHKFDSVLRSIPSEFKYKHRSILDVGCFAGSFLGSLPEGMFARAVGVDILSEQIRYAKNKYENTWRNFYCMDEKGLSQVIREPFDVITLIEVIEHLTAEQIRNLLDDIIMRLQKGGVLILTTPNYLSLWPALEFLVNRLSSVQYEEQHLTKFNVLNLEPRMNELSEGRLQLLQMTTTHFLTPYLAALNYDLAVKVSGAVPSSKWKNPFGNLILSVWKVR